MFDAGSAVAKIKADLTDFKKGISTAKEEVGGFGGKLEQVGGMLKTGLLVAGAAAGAGMVALGKSALDAAADFEQTRISFETMLGSADKAAKLLNELKDFAKKTPFNLTELQESTKRLLAYGIESENVIKTLGMLGDITSGVGKDKLPQLILAFGQVKAATKLTGAELRQFSEAGVPLLDALVQQANKAGGSWQMVGGAAKKSKVDVAELNDKLSIAKQRLKEASESGKAKESTLMSLKNTIQNYEQKISSATVATGEAKKMWVESKVSAEDMIKKISDGEIKFEDVQKALAGMTAEGGKFNGMMEKQSQSLSGQISNLQDSWQQLLVQLGTIFIPMAIQVVQALNSFIAPIQEVIGGSKSLYDVFGLTAEQTAFLQSVFNEFISFLFDTLLPAVFAVTSYLGARWNEHKDMFVAVWQIIWGFIQIIWGLIYGLLKVGLELLAGDWKGAWEAMKQAAQTIWNGIKSIFEGAMSFIWSWGKDVFNRMVQPFVDAWNRISEYVNKIKDALDFTKRHSPSVVDIVKKGVSEVNRALEGLEYGVNMTPNMAASVVSGGQTTQTIGVNIDMGNAIISDYAAAERIGEMIGDSIMRKLSGNIRF